MKNKNNTKIKTGFTLIELIVVIAIIGIIAGFIIIKVSGALSQARDTKRKARMPQIQQALERYKAKYGSYKVTYQATGEVTGDRQSGEGWISFENGGGPPDPYYKAITRQLYEDGFLNTWRIYDPFYEGISDAGYMLFICNSDQSYGLYATLENPTAQDINKVSTACDGSTAQVYGKNYVVTN